MESKIVFPKDFWWGGASWATGYEGARGRNGMSEDVWDRWHRENPEVFFDELGPQDTINFIDNYKEYVKLMKDISFNSFRFSISWARLLPNAGKKLNSEAVEYYKNLINELKESGIKPILCLHHFDLPTEIQDMGGWPNREIIPHFLYYAKNVFELYGDMVDIFMVHNEVGVQPEMGYLYGFQPPAEKNFKKSIAAGYNLLLAQAKSIELYRNMNYKGEIGTILNPNPVYPRSKDPKDVEAAKFVDMIKERFYLDISVKGEIPQDFIHFISENNLTPTITRDDVKVFKENTIDLLGVNYYQPSRVKARETKWDDSQELMPEKFFERYEWPERVMNESRGWEIYPRGIYETLKRIQNEYGNIKCFIGENGMGIEKEEEFLDENGTVIDNYRIDFFRDHLYWLHKAIEEGSNCIGYNVWAPFDNWSPVNTFKNRYGLYRYDLDTKEMKVKKSGEWFKKVAKENTLSIKKED